MELESNKRLVRRFYEEIVSTGDVERIDAFVAPDCVEADGLVRIEAGSLQPVSAGTREPEDEGA